MPEVEEVQVNTNDLFGLNKRRKLNARELQQQRERDRHIASAVAREGQLTDGVAYTTYRVDSNGNQVPTTDVDPGEFFERQAAIEKSPREKAQLLGHARTARELDPHADDRPESDASRLSKLQSKLEAFRHGNA